MSIQWFYVDDNEKVGPIEDAEFRSMVADGQVSGETFVWCKGLENWTKVEDIEEFSEETDATLVLEEEEPTETDLDIEGPVKEMELQHGEFDGAMTELSHESIEAVINGHYVKQKVLGQVYGPYSLETIKKLVEEGRLDHQSYLFSSSMSEWVSLASIQELNLNSNEGEQFVDHAPYLIQNPEFDYVAMGQDLSTGGVTIITKDHWGNPGDSLKLVLFSKDLDANVELSGQVERILDFSQGIFVRFQNVNNENMNLINSLINKHALLLSA